MSTTATKDETDNKDVVDRVELSRTYDELTKKFIKACHDFDKDFRPSIEKVRPQIMNDLYLQWHLEPKALGSQSFCLLIVPPQQNIDIPMVKNSVDFIKDISKRVIFAMNDLELNTSVKIELQVQDIVKFRNRFMDIEKNATRIQATIPDIMQLDEAASECSNYFQSIIDIDFISRYFKSIIYNIDEVINNKNKNSRLAQILEFVKQKDFGLVRIFEIVKNRINTIAHRFKGTIGHFCTFVLDSLDDSVNKVGVLIKEISEKSKQISQKVIDGIVEAFAILSERFLILVGQLTESMFKFLTQFQSIAKTKDYKVSKMDVKIPSVTFEPVSLFTLSIPIPKIESPDILITIENKSI